MKRILVRLIALFSIVFLSGSVFAESYDSFGFFDDEEDDFFEFVVVEEPVAEESALDETVLTAEAETVEMTESETEEAVMDTEAEETADSVEAVEEETETAVEEAVKLEEPSAAEETVVSEEAATVEETDIVDVEADSVSSDEVSADVQSSDVSVEEPVESALAEEAAVIEEIEAVSTETAVEVEASVEEVLEPSAEEAVLPEVTEETVIEAVITEPSSQEPEAVVTEPAAVETVEVPAQNESGTVPEENTTEPVAAAQEEVQPVVQEEEPVDEMAPSRSITIKKRQYLDVTYPGEGWLYLGDENNSKTLSYKGREQKNNKTVFKFYSDRTGTALLHFYRHDNLTDKDIHDYLLVEIDKTSGNRQRIDAPEYIPPVIKETVPEIQPEEEVLPEAEKEAVEGAETVEGTGAEGVSEETGETTEVSSGEGETEASGTEGDTEETEGLGEAEETEGTAEGEEEAEVIPDEPVIEDIIIDTGITFSDEPDVIFSFGGGAFEMSEFMEDDDYYLDLIDQANDDFFSGRYQDGIDKAQIVIDDGSYFSDEALYIQAQIYEANSEVRDLNKAYELYKMIVNYYPESSFWSKASKRVTYLERYYINIR